MVVVIPYLSRGAQGCELELAVTGWRKYFKEDHVLVVIGDYDRNVKASGAAFIPCPQIPPVEGEYLPHLDIVHKFRVARRFFPRSKDVIYTCDDIYPVRDFTLEDLRPKWFDPFIKEFDWRKEKNWWRDLGKTREVCREQGLPEYNWVCHLPVVYDWEKLIGIYDKYGCDSTSYIVENLYFNTYPEEAQECRDYQDEVKTSSPVLRPLGSVPFITNTNSGWSLELESILRKRYE